ncbi:glycoside hydrolase family protein [Spirochaetia bacterium]|nr:glycoside hydrolase family protein [Spirochaetia bacterium]
MSECYPVLLVLGCHSPLASHPKEENPESPYSIEELQFFGSISDTYLPLLAVFEKLEADRIPFRMAIALSPVLCEMLKDLFLQNRYLEYVDRQIEFGAKELERYPADSQMHQLAKFHYDEILEKRILFTERYEKNLLNIFNYYQGRGRLELLSSAATHAFLPVFTAAPEAIQVQLETAIASHRSCFGKLPGGFFLPDFGWSPELDKSFRSYNIGYTTVASHGALFGDPPAAKGCFYPLISPSKVSILIRDFYADRDVPGMNGALPPPYRDCRRDAGFELSPDLLEPFLEHGKRIPAGYKYWTSGGNSDENDGVYEGVYGNVYNDEPEEEPFSPLYKPETAVNAARKAASRFLDSCAKRLSTAAALMTETPISVCAWDADRFGRLWYEGPVFIEALFRGAAARSDVHFMNPGEYLSGRDFTSFQISMPSFSSCGPNGYGEMWMDASNDWVYPHLMRAIDRMTELAERFPNINGLKERALNQACREILLAQSSDWIKMLYQRGNSAYARGRIEEALRNFTTIYESLSSNYINTEWLTGIERKNGIFPKINYRIFRRKH